MTGSPEDRFLAALAARPADRPIALGGPVAALARAMAGPQAVSVVTGPTTRRALAAAGKPAATIGRSIYLARRPDRSAQSIEMLAHELVHARSGSTQPRFFGGRQNAEERQADQVGAFAARMIAHGSPPLRPERDASSWTPLPSSRSATLRRRLTDPVRSVAGARPGTEGLPVGGVAGLFGAGTGTKSGSGASGGSGVTDSGSGSVSANVLAGGQAGPLELLRRSVGGAPQSPPLPAPAPASGWSAETASFGASSSAGGGFGPNVGRSGNDVSRSGDSSVLQRRAAQPVQSPAQTTESHGEADRSTTNLLDNVDALLETLEERIIAQLERRGLRLGGIF